MSLEAVGLDFVAVHTTRALVDKETQNLCDVQAEQCCKPLPSKIL